MEYKTKWLNDGVKITLNGKSIIISNIIGGEASNPYTNEQLKGIIKIFFSEFDEIYKGDIYHQDGNVANPKLYKFISSETYKKYISKGKFQLGSLQYYREIENLKIKDRKEGLSHVILENKGHILNASVISGFDKYLFCASTGLDDMSFKKGNFGDYVMEIANVRSFSEAVSKSIGAKKWTVKKVFYSDYKAYKMIFQEDIGLDLNILFKPELVEKLITVSEMPSVFGKPYSFKPEEEIRIAFDLGKDVKKKCLQFHNPGLLDYIDIRKI